MLKQPSPEYRGFRTAGIRLSEEMLPQLQKLAAGRSRPMLEALHAFDKAHAVMLVEEGLVAHDAGAAMLTALRRMETEGVEAARTRTGGGLHSGEQYLIRAEAEAEMDHTLEAIADINVIRQRAGLSLLTDNLTKQQVLMAVAQERRVEVRILVNKGLNQ